MYRFLGLGSSLKPFDLVIFGDLTYRLTPGRVLAACTSNYPAALSSKFPEWVWVSCGAGPDCCVSLAKRFDGPLEYERFHLVPVRAK